MKRVGILVAVVLAAWGLVAVPSRHLWGDWTLGYSAAAALLCLAPAMATLAWAGWAMQRAPDQLLIMVLGGTGVRLFVVAVGALALQTSIPFFQEHEGFWAWLLLFYLLTLTAEMWLILSGQPSDHK